MYFNDIHIILYVIIGLVGCVIGQITGIFTNRFIQGKEIISIKELAGIKEKVTPYYIFMIAVAICFIGVLYGVGIQNNIYSYIDLIKYILLVPILISIFYIDLKKEIIPNRLVLTTFELGLVCTFLVGVLNPNGTSFAIDKINGMLVGGGIFLIITLIGGIMAGKEAMGFGDVKLMATLGLFVGVENIIVISVLAFLIGAVVSVIMIIAKLRKTDDYIAFGPFIVIATILNIIIPNSLLFVYLWKIISGRWFIKLIKG